MTRELSVLNKPSDIYTSDGPIVANNIDISLPNTAAIEKLKFSWTVKNSLGINDQNMIILTISRDCSDDGIRKVSAGISIES